MEPELYTTKNKCICQFILQNIYFYFGDIYAFSRDCNLAVEVNKLIVVDSRMQIELYLDNCIMIRMFGVPENGKNCNCYMIKCVWLKTASPKRMVNLWLKITILFSPSVNVNIKGFAFTLSCLFHNPKYDQNSCVVT